MTISKPDIVARYPERKTILPYVLHMASGKIIPVLKETLLELSWCEAH